MTATKKSSQAGRGNRDAASFGSASHRARHRPGRLTTKPGRHIPMAVFGIAMSVVFGLLISWMWSLYFSLPVKGLEPKPITAHQIANDPPSSVVTVPVPRGMVS